MVQQFSSLEQMANEIKMAEELLQGIERKFQLDFQRSVDQMLLKMKVFLKNGSSVIQLKLRTLEDQLADLRHTLHDNQVVDHCLQQRQNATASLAEGALRQMARCGRSQTGPDPVRARACVARLKDQIREGMRPIHEKAGDVLNIMKMCAHDHDSRQKVIKCVIAKSPVIKAAMTEISSKLSSGVADLTRLVARGAAREACLLGAVGSAEDAAAGIVSDVTTCARAAANVTDNLRAGVSEEVAKFKALNNATVLDTGKNILVTTGGKNVVVMKVIV